MVSYSAWREAFAAEMVREGMSLDTARKIMRKGATLDRLAIAACNGDFPADNGERPTVVCSECACAWHRSAIRKDGRCVDCHTAEQLRALLPEGFAAEFAGDPRGCVVKIKTPSGREVGVPAKG